MIKFNTLIVVVLIVSSCAINNQNRLHLKNNRYGGKNPHLVDYQDRKARNIFFSIAVPAVIILNIVF